MPRDTSPARSFVWQVGLNFGLRRILAVARTDDQMARNRDLLYPGVLLRERTSDGGGAVARAHRLSCGRPRAAEGLEVGGWARLSAGLLGAF